MQNKNNSTQTTVTQEVPGWKLNLAYWYTENKGLIKRGLIFLIFFIDLVILFVGGSVYVNYRAGLISDQNYLSDLPKNLVNNYAELGTAPQDLVVEEVKIVHGSQEKNNLLVKINNKNSEWAVKNLTYTFVVNGQELGAANTFILPQSEKYLIAFHAPLGTNVSFKIINTEWKRMRDYSLVSYKDGLKISDQKFIPNQTDLIAGQTDFTIENKTPYSFWEVGLAIILIDPYGEPTAVNYMVINKLRSQEQRSVTANWEDPIARTVASVAVFPEVNLLESSAIMKLEAGPGDAPGFDSSVLRR